MGDVHRSDSETAPYLAQCRFLEYVQAECPQALAELRLLLDLPPDDQAGNIDQWARRHRLLKDGRPPRWIVNTAHATLQLWTENPNMVGWCHPSAADWGVLGPEDQKISFTTRWNPYTETRKAADERIKREIATHMDQIEALTNNAVKTSVVRAPGALGWLARYLVNKESPAHISASGRPYYASEKSVKQAVRDAAALIGLTLPLFPMVGRPGRPRRKDQTQLRRNRPS
jgi:hypothetical protein